MKQYLDHGFDKICCVMVDQWFEAIFFFGLIYRKDFAIKFRFRLIQSDERYFTFWSVKAFKVSDNYALILLKETWDVSEKKSELTPIARLIKWSNGMKI